MADLWSSLISGALTGGAGAATTVFAFFRDARKRLDMLEKAVGTPGSAVEPKTGLYALWANIAEAVKQQDDSQRKLRRELEDWHDEPPDWLARALNRRALSSSNLEQQQEFEQRVDQRIKMATDRVRHLEEAFDALSERLNAMADRIVRDSSDKLLKDAEDRFVDVQSYEEEARKRTEEIRKIQENLHAANGFLRGVMAALGYLDPDSTPPSSSAGPPLPLRRK